jgi:hypothetical protein
MAVSSLTCKVEVHIVPISPCRTLLFLGQPGQISKSGVFSLSSTVYLASNFGSFFG